LSGGRNFGRINQKSKKYESAGRQSFAVFARKPQKRDRSPQLTKFVLNMLKLDKNLAGEAWQGLATVAGTIHY
jgi:hypothetical protein